MSDATPQPPLSRTGADPAGALTLGGCAIGELAAEAGTPVMLADEVGMRHQAQQYLTAFRTRHPATDVVFASKALPVPAIAGLFASEGLGCDVASAGELALALAGGVRADTVVVHGNAKTDRDLQAALDAEVGLIVIDSADEVDRLARLVARGDRTQSVLIRVIPGVRAHDQDAIATGHEGSKFGVRMEEFEGVRDRVDQIRGLHLEGLHFHVGSQLFDLDPLLAAVRALAALPRFATYDVGGGLGVPFHPDDLQAPSVETYAERLVDVVHAQLGRDLRLVIEPGRSLVAEHVVTVYRVVAVKRGGPTTIVAVDGGMSDNMLPRLGERRLRPFVLDVDRPAERCDVVGPHCESGDRLVSDIALASPRVDDLMVVPVTGAYTASLANNYNGMLRPPLVLCRDGEPTVATRRETHADLLARHVVAGDGAS